MSNSSINIALPETMKLEVEETVKNNGYGNTSEFFRDLFRDYKKREQEQRLEKLLLESLEGSFAPLTNADFEDVKSRVKARLAKKAGKIK